MGDKNFRLPEDVRPVRYRALLQPSLATRSFAGRVSIELKLASPRREITLHAVELDVMEALVRQGSQIQRAMVIADAESETVKLVLPSALSEGEAELTIDYRGHLNPGLRGLYQAGSIVVTQFEAADARRAFPCFDEPSFKARWALSVELAPEAPADAVVLSNGPVVRDEKDPKTGARKVEFGETPLLSSYLIAVVVGRLSSSPPAAVRGVQVRTWAVPEKLHLTAFAQECAGAVLPALEDYFAVPYPFAKLDQIGIPNFEAGAMENAGAITFREVALLTDPQAGSLAMLKRVAEVITHELAHQWFGNLVTMVWWDDLWLNEAFATWMAYKIVDGWRPAWRMWIEFEGGKAAGLALDALATTHPIRAEVRNAAEAGENFDAITYEKGGAVLRMIEGYLGAEKFRDGLREYIRRHAHGNARADDLWRALSDASGQPVGELANVWLRETGFPLIEAKLDGTALELRQRRFYADPTLFQSGGDVPVPPRPAEPVEPPPTARCSREGIGKGSIQKWMVPVVVRYGDADGVEEERFLLRDATGRFPLKARGPVKWLCANARGTGFFRVAYDAAGLAGLAGNVAALDAIERMNLLGDQWALVRAGAARVEPLLQLVASLGAEADYAVLDEVVSRLSAVEYRLLEQTERPRFASFVEGLLGPQLDKLGWAPALGEDDGTRLRRAAVIRGLGLVARTRRVIAEAEARLLRLDAEPGAIDPNLLDAVVVMAARAGDAARFDAFARRVPKETDPAARRRFLLALASFEDPALARRATELLLDELVALQDLPSFVGRLLENPAAREGAWRFLRDRWEDLARRAESPTTLRRIIEALPLLPEPRHVAEVEELLSKHPIEGARQAAAQALERMRLDAELRARVAPQVSGWLLALAGC